MAQRYIYALFVGILLAIFVGMGVAVFYESPTPPEEPSWYGYSSGKYEPTSAQLKEEEEYNNKMREFDKKEMSEYNRNVSIIVISASVVILALSLLLEKQLGVIADGLLLGGIFTLLYGVGRGIAVDSNKFRFLIASISLLLAIALGYLKFVTPRLKVKR